MTLPLIEAKSEGQPAGGVPPKGVSQSRSMACSAGCRIHLTLLFLAEMTSGIKQPYNRN